MLDVCMKHQDQLAISVHDDLELMKAALAHARRLATLPQHPLSRMTAGLLRKLDDCTTAMGYASFLDGSPFQQFDFRLPITQTAQNEHDGLFEPCWTVSIGRYEFSKRHDIPGV